MGNEKEVFEQEEEINKEQASEVDESDAAADEEVEHDKEAEEESEEVDLEAELSESKDKYLRLYSEFENYRRRTAKEKIDLIGSASRDVIEALLPILDDFERAIQAGEEGGSEDGDKDNGVALIYNKLKKVLESKGLKQMQIKPGDSFDDEFHEAISQIPAPKKKLEGKIVDVIEPGYYLNDKVIRFAKVVTGAKG